MAVVLLGEEVVGPVATSPRGNRFGKGEEFNQMVRDDLAAPVLEAKNLVKTLGGRTVVDDITFEVCAGEVFGFLGPNGAGKTTTIRLLTGLARPTSGEVSIAGHDLLKDHRRAIRHVGCIVENPELYKYLTAMENLRQFARLRGEPDWQTLYDLLAKVGLAAEANHKVATFSLGMRQRLGLAQALVGRPRILILDEPMNGLDPAGMKEIRELLRALAHQEGLAVFLSSHLLHEVQVIADRVMVINHGRTVTAGRVDTLLVSRVIGVRVDQPEPACRALKKAFNCSPVLLDEEIHLPLPAERISEVVQFLTSKGFAIQAIAPKEQELEQVFFQALQEDTTVAAQAG